MTDQAVLQLPDCTPPGMSGFPTRSFHRTHRAPRPQPLQRLQRGRCVRQWLRTPVEHVRDLRTELLLNSHCSTEPGSRQLISSTARSKSSSPSSLQSRAVPKGRGLTSCSHAGGANKHARFRALSQCAANQSSPLSLHHHLAPERALPDVEQRAVCAPNLIMLAVDFAQPIEA